LTLFRKYVIIQLKVELNNEDEVDTTELIQLAEEFGLPCIEREGFVTVIGLIQFLEFRETELNFIKLEETLNDN